MLPSSIVIIDYWCKTLSFHGEIKRSLHSMAKDLHYRICHTTPEINTDVISQVAINKTMWTTDQSVSELWKLYWMINDLMNSQLLNMVLLFSYCWLCIAKARYSHALCIFWVCFTKIKKGMLPLPYFAKNVKKTDHLQSVVRMSWVDMCNPTN